MWIRGVCGLDMQSMDDLVMVVGADMARALVEADGFPLFLLGREPARAAMDRVCAGVVGEQRRSEVKGLCKGSIRHSLFLVWLCFRRRIRLKSLKIGFRKSLRE